MSKSLAHYGKVRSAKHFLASGNSSFEERDAEDGKVFGANQVHSALVAAIESAPDDLYGLPPIVIGRKAYSGDSDVGNSRCGLDLLDQRVIVVHPLLPAWERFLRKEDSERQDGMAIESQGQRTLQGSCASLRLPGQKQHRERDLSGNEHCAGSCAAGSRAAGAGRLHHLANVWTRKLQGGRQSGQDANGDQTAVLKKSTGMFSAMTTSCGIEYSGIKPVISRMAA